MDKRVIFMLLVVVGYVLTREACSQPKGGLQAEDAKGANERAIRNYIKEHAPTAQREMLHYRIPASITLAQGILESRWGQSELAKKANNHFGIKWAKGWEGGKYSVHSKEWLPETQEMKSKLSVFRYYDSAEGSYRDHSEFLACRGRYASLFDLELRDYAAWAEGLQACGYATDPEYSNKIVSLIKRFELHRYDE